MTTNSALRAHLVTSGLAGSVGTPRETSLRVYRLFAGRDPRATLGLDPLGSWRFPEVAELMGQRCGRPADPPVEQVPGQRRPEPSPALRRDVIDPDRTLAALDAFAARLATAAARREPVLLGTGHPGRLLDFYSRIGAALAAVGCPALTPAEGAEVRTPTRFGVRAHRLAYVAGVAHLRDPASRSGGCGGGVAGGVAGAVHCHSPLPVRTALAASAGGGLQMPSLVIGDHGWVCGAGQLGVEAMGLADTDDPALFVGQAEGRISVVVPLDDGVHSDEYRPVVQYVLARAGLAR